jgi:hypothetical protein
MLIPHHSLHPHRFPSTCRVIVITLQNVEPPINQIYIRISSQSPRTTTRRATERAQRCAEFRREAGVFDADVDEVDPAQFFGQGSAGEFAVMLEEDTRAGEGEVDCEGVQVAWGHVRREADGFAAVLVDARDVEFDVCGCVVFGVGVEDGPGLVGEVVVPSRVVG